MAAPDNSPHLQQVLHNYKNQARNSLQGPGANEILLENTAKTGHQQPPMYPFYNFKKALLYGNVMRPPNNDDSVCKKADNDTAKWHRQDIKPPEKSLQRIAFHNTKLNGMSEGGAAAGRLAKDKTNLPIRVTIKKEPSEKCTNKDASDKPKAEWGEARSFRGPAPFAPQPWPILASADPGIHPEMCSAQSVLDGEVITCFIIGGEPRLCLPQVLYTVLRMFSLTQINQICDELQIYCSGCTPLQLQFLKDVNIVPSTAVSSGLITKTDAERLTHALLYSPPMQPVFVKDVTKSKQSGIRVSHSCFGKCKGILWPEFYSQPQDLCIECLECHVLYSTHKFVCHGHRSLENQTCHWGFDSTHWRKYLMLSRDQTPLTLHEAELQLTAFKSKFDGKSNCPTNKRKQFADTKEDLGKKARMNSVNAFPPNPAHYEAVFPSYVWGATPPFTVIPVPTKDAPTVAVPASLVKESLQTCPSDYLAPACQVLVDTADPFGGTDNGKTKLVSSYLPPPIATPLKLRHKMLRRTNSSFTPTHKAPVGSPQITEKGTRDELILIKLEANADDGSLVVNSKESSLTASCPEAARPPSDPTECSLDEQRTCKSSFIKTEYPPDLELSTTDSDTESINSVTSKSEVVEEAEALLRGWNDRAAANKVLELVASLAKVSLYRENQISEALREKVRLQEVLAKHQHDISESKEETVLRETVDSLQSELSHLKAQLSEQITIKTEDI